MKVRKPRAKGYKCDRKEDRDRPEITRLLRKDGWVVTYVEPRGIYKKDEGFNLGDVWLKHIKMGTDGWGEYKSSIGKLKPGQIKFRDDCKLCNTKYWVIRLDGNGGYVMLLYGE